MKRRPALVLLFTVQATVLGGCTDKDPVFPDIQPPTPQLRIINAVHNLNTTTAPGSAIDVTVNGDLAPLGVVDLPGSEVRDYVEVTPGVHSFTTRITGQPDATNLFGFVARQFLAEGQYYTLLVVGVNPATGTPAANSIQPIIINRDPFAPPKTGDVYQARINFINGALFSAGTSPTGASVRMFVDPGTAVITDVAQLAGRTPASTRAFAARPPQYVNLDAGSYVLTFATASSVLKSVPVTLAAGEVRTFALLSTEPAADPGPANHIVHKLLDATY